MSESITAKIYGFQQVAKLYLTEAGNYLEQCLKEKVEWKLTEADSKLETAYGMVFVLNGWVDTEGTEKDKEEQATLNTMLTLSRDIYHELRK